MSKILEESIFKLNKYYDYDDIEYKGIRNVENLFNQSTDEGYYKPIKPKVLLMVITENIKVKEIKI